MRKVVHMVTIDIAHIGRTLGKLVLLFGLEFVVAGFLQVIRQGALWEKVLGAIEILLFLAITFWMLW